MIRWLLIALFIYLIYKLIRGPRPARQQKDPFRFGGFQNRNNSDAGSNSKRRKNLDQIEEAEFEDITNKEKKNG
jgi:hypothetical protein